MVYTYKWKRHRSHTQTQDTNNTTNDHNKDPTPLTTQRSKVARRRCVAPPTPGSVLMNENTIHVRHVAGWEAEHLPPELHAGFLVLLVPSNTRGGGVGYGLNLYINIKFYMLKTRNAEKQFRILFMFSLLYEYSNIGICTYPCHIQD